MIDIGTPLTDNNILVHKLTKENVRVSVRRLDGDDDIDVVRVAHQTTMPVGVLIDGHCDQTQALLLQASRNKLFDAVHPWLVLTDIEDDNCTEYVMQTFRLLNLSVNADVAVVTNRGLDIVLKGYKYYNRWDFHNLTLRAITVIVDQPKMFYPEMLSEMAYTAGVAAMTKITSQMLNTIKERHNFRTKFYYLIPEKGVGQYENRFLTPLSHGVWCCAFFAGIACTLVLAGAARMEDRPKPELYAFFSVFAAVCQQGYEDGVQLLEQTISSQGRRLTLLVIGLTSMLLYNYYTSSVVSWLLNAAAPSIANLDGLINSDFELVFEDIGYTRGWLDNPGFFYYSGFKNVKEDELRDKKVTKAKRTVSVLQNVNKGVELLRTGKYAFHTEPYTASQVISKTYEDKELCNLGALQMMLPAHVYIMAQKRSPYKEFFDWSLLRLLERGHVKAIRARFAGTMPACSGAQPRALALGQAAPAFLMLAAFAMLSCFILNYDETPPDNGFTGQANRPPQTGPYRFDVQPGLRGVSVDAVSARAAERVASVMPVPVERQP
ncbi:unnamed protein product [Spodoptera exigua]|nr:unnamed protein product [Spodoptera exigua]